MEIHSGEVVAIVGENGSGKTTLAKLLCGLYQPTAGTITWGDLEMGDTRPDIWTRRTSVLFQDFGRYAFTAVQNIAMGRLEDDNDTEGVLHAAEAAAVHSIITALPDGYATRLGPEFEGGTDLSTGQWQRLALARTFFRNAPVTILDEPTASLDPETERAILQRVLKVQQERTVVLISHRLSSVRSADRIFVLRRGRIVEQGVHDELMVREGVYAELFRSSASPDVDGVCIQAQRV
jgi:ATP-binding cassette subfamily B protein